MARRQLGVMLIPAPLACLPDDAHLTVVYAGDDASESDVRGLDTITKMLASRVDPFAARTLGVNYNFGDDHDEPVIIIGLTPELVHLRGPLAVHSKSSYSEFRPHIAVPDIRDYTAHGWKIPRDLYFNKICVWVDSDAVCEYYLGSGTPV